jgi:hypothetical protein
MTNAKRSPEDYQVVLNLNRWSRTTVKLSMRERLASMLTGKINLDDMLGYDSIGWVPVFERVMDAQAYVREMAPEAKIVPVKPP